MSSPTRPARPIIIVTGANNGVGFGICRRLLYGLAQDRPDDARPLFPRSGADEPGIEYPCAGLTLIMACRSRQRAEAARTQLLSLFDSDVERLRKLPGGAERVIAFRANLVIAVHILDLASVQSTLAFADEVARTYPYVSHLVCNAGVAPFLNISWSLLLRQVWRNFLELDMLQLVTIPNYNIQRTAMMSDDGLGWVWQCNVFGHYILCRALEAKLAASQTGPGRVLWMSSLTAHADNFYDPTDWQLVDSSQPYEGSKFQIELIRAELSRRAGPASPVRHFTVHPGVVFSSIDAALVGGFMSQMKLLVFYLARCLGSLHHNISSWNGAAAMAHVCLAPLAFIPVFLSAVGTPTTRDKGQQEEDLLPAYLHSVTDRMGHSGVALAPFYGWPEHEKTAARLVDRCEGLYQSFVAVGGKSEP
ncbi:NAD(P)-binding protein [Lactifluus volemus]|nr:NAD(P)-binding protein [Lactifluus volemus]